MAYFLYVLIGLMAGVSSGLFGIGGGLIIVPLLVFFTKISQHAAAGISLVALLMPVGVLAVYEYYSNGRVTKVDIGHGLLIGLGMFAGAYVGARLGLGLSESTMRRAFAVFLILVGVRMFLVNPAAP
jgi:uncharacterized membrane protein YfcA